MGFSISYKDHVVHITLTNNVLLTEVQEVLAIITKLLDKEKPFVFIVDTSGSNGAPPISTGIVIVKWMRKNKQKIIKTLSASSIVFKSAKISALLTWVFTKQKPSAPNLITTSLDDAIKFTKTHLDEITELINQ
jgi:hypothetical protein